MTPIVTVAIALVPSLAAVAVSLTGAAIRAREQTKRQNRLLVGHLNEAFAVRDARSASWHRAVLMILTAATAYGWDGFQATCRRVLESVPPPEPFDVIDSDE